MVAASACLLGYRCRYDGRTSPSAALIERASKEAILPICPEELGGLPTPRSPSYLHGGDGFDVLDGRAKVLNRDGHDVTGIFLKGAVAALRKAMEGEDAAEIKRCSEELTNASHKLAEAMYQQASAGEQQGADAAGAESSGQAGGAAPDEDVVDADFEEVKEDEKK